MRAGVHDRLQARRTEQLGRRQGLQHRRREHLSCDDALATGWHAAAARIFCRDLDRRERDLDSAYRPGACLSGPLNMARLPSITTTAHVAAKDRETWHPTVASRAATGAAPAPL